MSVGPISSIQNASNPVRYAAAASAQALPPELSAEQRGLIRSVKAIAPADLFGENSELTFVFDRDAKKVLVRVVDRATHEVVMQIPAEYALELAREAKSR
jgi:hypothetical protein